MKTVLSSFVLFITFFIASNLFAADSMVDMADSTNFEEFHEAKDDAISVFGSDEPAVTIDVSRESSSGGLVTQQILPGSGTKVDTSAHKPGQDYIIRARYSLDPTRVNQYDLFEAMVMLHKQMNTLCPLGWEKDKEWMEPIDQDYFLHFRFTCLNKTP